MKDKVIVLVPEAPVPVAENTAPKPRRLKPGNMKIGLLDNGKGNVDHLLRFRARSSECRARSRIRGIAPQGGA